MKPIAFVCVTALAWSAAAEPWPVNSLAGARLRVKDVAKASEFYARVFGLQESGGGKQGAVTFRINSRQFVEFAAAEPDSSAHLLETVTFGISGGPAAPLKDQDGRQVEFLAADAGARGVPAGGRSISEHLLHVGLGTADLNRAIEFYAARFGCKEIWRGPTPREFRIVILRTPGPHEEFVEFLLRGEQGSPDHICLDVPDIQQAYKTLLERGAVTRGKPRIASNGHWVINLADSNGLRVELMEPRPAAK